MIICNMKIYIKDNASLKDGTFQRYKFLCEEEKEIFFCEFTTINCKRECVCVCVCVCMCVCTCIRLYV